MSSPAILEASAMARARAWRDAGHAAVCDRIEPWAYGTVARAGSYPTYYGFNVLRVEREMELTVGQLTAEADRALSELEHRRIDFDLIAEAEPRRAAFEAAGWKTTRLLWMLHEQLPEGPAGPPVEVIDYDEAAELRAAWHLEDFAELEYERYAVAAREIAIRKGARTLAVRKEGVPVAFAQIQWGGGAAEIDSVYVHRDHRGRGLGTALTRAAVTAAATARELWIVADDEDRAKDLYERLGFRAAWTTMELLRLP